MSKSQLAVYLSKLEHFSRSKVRLEQYETESEIAAEVLWDASMSGDIEGKEIADLGAGTGILGITALMLGAKKVFFVEKDKDAISVLKKNIKAAEQEYEIGEYGIIHSDVAKFYEKVDVVIQNPPFGTRDKHADKEFLEKAFSVADIVYSFHKESTTEFIEKFSKDNCFKTTRYWSFKFPLKQTQQFHKKKIERIEVGCWRLEKRK